MYFDKVFALHTGVDMNDRQSLEPIASLAAQCGLFEVVQYIDDSVGLGNHDGKYLLKE